MPRGAGILYGCLMAYGGQLIASRSPGGPIKEDGDRLSNFLEFILQFVERAYPSSRQAPFEALDHGSIRILIEKGRFCMLILVIEGKEDETLRQGMREILVRFEERNEPELAQATVGRRVRQDGRACLATASNLMKVF